MIIMQTEPATSDASITPSFSPQRIVLTGFMGAGKSTVGRMLAVELGWQFVDVDQAVEERAGISIADIFLTCGEASFRRQESVAIARALGRCGVVIALGGGAPELLANRLLLEQTAATTVIFLDAPFAILFDRCILQEGAALRPVLQDAEAAAQRFLQRVPHYRRCAHHHVATVSHTPRQTVAEIVRLLRT